MGCGSSHLARSSPLPPPIDWSRYEPTGNSSTDQQRAKELAELASENRRNDNLHLRCLTQARQLDPSSSDIALSLAGHYNSLAMYGHLHKSPYDEQNNAIIRQNYAKAENLYAESYRLATSSGDQFRGFESWANAVIKQGSHRQADRDHILELEEQARPRDYTDIAKDANTAFYDGRVDDALSLYRSAYDQSHESRYLTRIARCYISANGLTSPEAMSATRTALHEVSILVKNPTGPATMEPVYEETFLKGVIAAAPLFKAAQARERQGDLTGAAEAGTAAFWALQHSQIIDFQCRVLSAVGRFKDCERMLDFERRDSPSTKDRRLIPLYLQQDRYTMAHNLLQDIYLKLPNGPEKSSLYEVDQQCIASRTSALDIAQKTINNPAVDGPALAKVALFFYFEKEHDLSIQALQKAIASEPNVGQYHGDLADSLYALKRRDEAETYYKKALSLDSSSLQRLIWSVRTQFDPLTAEYFADMLKWDPHAENFAWIGSTFKYGRTFAGTTKAWDAITAYNTALSLQPDHPQAPQWREGLKKIERLVEKVKAESEMERLHGDPTKMRLLGQQNYQRFGYGVPGSWNQFNTAYWQAQVPY